MPKTPKQGHGGKSDTGTRASKVMSSPKKARSISGRTIRSNAISKSGAETDIVKRNPARATHRSDHGRDQDLMREFFDAEAACAAYVIPFERKALHKEIQTILDLTDRLANGKDLIRKPFIRSLRNMQAVLRQIPEVRWQIIRPSVDRLIRDVDEDADAGDENAGDILDLLLREKSFFREALENADAHDSAKRLSEARKLAQDAAMTLKQKVEGRQQGYAPGSRRLD